MNYNWHTFQNFGYISYDFTDEQLLPIKTEIHEIKSNFELALPQKANSLLAGHMNKEYFLEKSFQYANDLIYPFIQLYDDQFNYVNYIDILNKPCDLVLDTFWVNFQKKHEFNPAHNHNGIMSFVIWIDIPYSLEQEQTVYPELPQKDAVSSTFYFEYTDIFGRIRHNYLPVNKSYENKMIIFPSCVNHGVYPFYTSDDYRISVSGNFKFNVK